MPFSHDNPDAHTGSFPDSLFLGCKPHPFSGKKRWGGRGEVVSSILIEQTFMNAIKAPSEAAPQESRLCFYLFFSSSFFFFFFLNVYLFLRGKEHERGRKRERGDRESEAGSALTVVNQNS